MQSASVAIGDKIPAMAPLRITFQCYRIPCIDRAAIFASLTYMGPSHITMCRKKLQTYLTIACQLSLVKTCIIIFLVRLVIFV